MTANLCGVSPDEAAGLLRPFAADRMHIAMEGGKEDGEAILEHMKR